LNRLARALERATNDPVARTEDRNDEYLVSRWQLLAAHLLADDDLLDALVAYRQQQSIAALTPEQRKRLADEIFTPDTEPYPLPEFVREVARLLAEEFYDVPESGDTHLVVQLPTEQVRIDFTQTTERPTE
jgi:hypothetical protein